jgi:hypothetical protein
MIDPCQQVTPEIMCDILGMPDSKAEAILFDRLRKIDDNYKLSYAEVGQICIQVQAYLLHEQHTDPDTGEPCSFSRWLHLAAPYSHSTCYAAMRDCEELKDIPVEHLAEMPSSSFSVLKQLSTAVRADPELIEAAKTKRTDDLVEHIREHHPDEHLEHRRTMKFRPDESAAEKIEEALRCAQLHGAASREQALELIAEEAMMQWRLEEEVAQALVGESKCQSQAR